MEPLSTIVTCTRNEGLRSGPYDSGSIYIESSYWGSPVRVSLILSPTNSIPMGTKSKYDILNTSSPPTSCSSTHCCTSSSEVVIFKGSSGADGVVC